MSRKAARKSKSRPILSDEEFSELWREMMPEPKVRPCKPEEFDHEGLKWALDTFFPREGESEAAHAERMAGALDDRQALERKRREQPN
jgi:hypothetical protein